MVPTLILMSSTFLSFLFGLENVSIVNLHVSLNLHLSHHMRKPMICIGENKSTDQLRADQRLCFRYTDSRIPLLLKSKISSFYPYSVTVQAGLCRTWSETQIVGFLMQRLICQLVVKEMCTKFW